MMFTTRKNACVNLKLKKKTLSSPVVKLFIIFMAFEYWFQFIKYSGDQILAKRGPDSEFRLWGE